jgi:hypothetical protein
MFWQEAPPLSAKDFQMELEKAKEIHAYYMSNNISLEVAGQKYGYTPSGLIKAFKKYDLPRKGRNSTRERRIDKGELARLYLEEEYSTLELAAHFNVAHGTITNRLLELGISRSQRESLALRNGFCYWTPELEVKVRESLVQTRSYVETGKLFGLKRFTIENKNLSEWRIPIHRWTPELSCKGKALLEKLRDYDAVAKELGIPRESVALKNNRSWRIDMLDNCKLYGVPTVGLDGFKYRSKLEAKVANFLLEHNIKYENEVRVTPDRKWRADFKVGEIYIEVDGLGVQRCEHREELNYDAGNEKILYYKANNLPYVILHPRKYKKQLTDLGLIPQEV